MTCLIYGKRSASGVDLETACTVTNADGDKFYLLAERSTGDVAVGSGGRGHLEFVGGTGVFAKMRGRCAYDTEYLANDQVVTTRTAPGAWSDPVRGLGLTETGPHA